MKERFRHEILKEWFFPNRLFREDGKKPPAPLEATALYQELKNEWLQNYPEDSRENPMVSLAPGEKDGKSGYFVRTVVQIPLPR